MFIEDKSHIGSLVTNRDQPTFTTDQLIQIYEAAGRSVEVEALRRKAAELFPDIKDEKGAPPLWRTEGVGRAFAMPDGSFQKPVWRLGSSYCRDVGILKDGTPLPY